MLLVIYVFARQNKLKLRHKFVKVPQNKVSQYLEISNFLRYTINFISLEHILGGIMHQILYFKIPNAIIIP